MVILIQLRALLFKSKSGFKSTINWLTMSESGFKLGGPIRFVTPNCPSFHVDQIFYLGQVGQWVGPASAMGRGYCTLPVIQVWIQMKLPLRILNFSKLIQLWKLDSKVDIILSQLYERERSLNKLALWRSSWCHITLLCYSTKMDTATWWCHSTTDPCTGEHRLQWKQ